ncbi:hypothetical protein IEQ34_008238 [Dendrobium chrysotoxum]|uniref:Uncharacterized protein n=1 Tax=Dendrobium chrysotoxum TaxID=161865 RepID=A0AAV7H573_DENCH|nr:hypothetical protein IEQ34_008238 [Dendrobium chrysotoxum]
MGGRASRVRYGWSRRKEFDAGKVGYWQGHRGIMAPKMFGKKMASSSFDMSRFISVDTESRFANLVIPTQPILHIIDNRGWESFCEEPYATIINAVQEFFINEKEIVDNRCYIRGKRVTFNSLAINKIYRLRDIEFDEYNAFINTLINPEEILNILRGPNSEAQWKKKENRIINFSASYITQTFKA